MLCFSADLGAESSLFLTTVCATVGAWLGAFPIPLDWDRPWQVGHSQQVSQN